MGGIVSQEETALLAQIERARGKLQEHAQELRAVDDELEALAPQRQQHQLLEQACSSLEKLGELGVASLIWGERVGAEEAAGQLRRAREQAAVFSAQLADLDARRRTILEKIGRAEEDLEILDDDLYDAAQQEERRKQEWVVERELGPLPAYPQRMAWARGGEDDWRYRKALAVSILASLLLGALLPMIDLPLPKRGELIEVPERLVQLLRQEQARAAPPPKPVEVPLPEQKPQEQKPQEQKPQEQKPKPTTGPTPDQQRGSGRDEAPALAAQPEAPKAEKAGILAFRDTFASLSKDRVAPRLGSDARINDADDASRGLPERSMLTSNAPGSSGGINLAALSRNAGGGGGGGRGGGGGGMQGVQVGRATSSIGGVGTADRPLASGGRASRTDEEIQIVFDRYKAALYRLYNRELRKDPSLRGQMVLRLTIEPDGRVSLCQLQASDMEAPELSAQVVDRVRTINFGAKDVEAMTILYPIDFLPAA